MEKETEESLNELNKILSFSEKESPTQKTEDTKKNKRKRTSEEEEISENNGESEEEENNKNHEEQRNFLMNKGTENLASLFLSK